MEELTNFVTVSEQLSQKEEELKAALAKVDLFKIEMGIEALKAEVDALKVERENLAIAGASLISEVGKFQVDGIEFGIKKGSESVQMKEGVDLKKLPAQFVTVSLSPNKIAIRKIAKQNPESIADFAEIVRAPDKLTYTVI